MRLSLPSMMVLMLVGACSGSGGADCGPSTCDGCCDSSGVCQGGTSLVACGAQGSSCDVCPAGVQACVTGRCVNVGSAGGGEGGGSAGGEAGGAAGGLAGGGSGGGTAGGTAGGSACSRETDVQFCARNSFSCGAQSGLDNCLDVRNVSSCGSCASGQFCNNGACRCQPESNAQLCARLATSCGSLTAADNCGASRTVSCGTCGAPNVCTAGRCVCTPETDAQFCTRRGVSCGLASGADNCGQVRTVSSCGTCTGANQCLSGSCSCPSESNAAFCTRLGAQCGATSGTDSCGNPRNVSSCGSCPSPKTCAGAGTPNQCGCTPQTDAELCQASNTSCGPLTVTDRCGMARTVASCGACASGTRCPTTGSAVNRVCQPFSCSTGQLACGQGCAACPTVGVATTACGAGDTCVAATCQADYVLSGGVCVPATCPSGQRSCGGTCRTCPSSGVVSTACNGPACIAASCVDGSGVSGGQCVPMSCGTGALFCSSACSACPTTGAATFGCDYSSCSARTCAAGYSLRGSLCVDSDWVFERVFSGVGSAANAAVAVDGAGNPVVAYLAGTNLNVSRRSTAGTWSTVATPVSSAYYYDVTQLAVDAAGNAHVIFTGGVTIGTDYTTQYNYLKVSPAGAPSMALAVGAVMRFSVGNLAEGDGVALAVDQNGDAHLAYNWYVSGVSQRLTYRRSFQGAWLSPVPAAQVVFGRPLIAVEGSGDVVHLAGGSYALQYTRGASSIFSAPVSVNMSGLSVKVLAVVSGTVELWSGGNTGWWRSTATPAAVSAPVQWSTGGAVGARAGRGPTGFASLERISGVITSQRGPASGVTETENTNLPFDSYLAVGAAVDSSGALHTLGWLRSTSSSSTYDLYWVRGH
ncbi:MAG: RHS repeat protein [Archangiaceae bacterium]|nr:RHS repeat protein [Archangiaceae bacterium]